MSAHPETDPYDIRHAESPDESSALICAHCECRCGEHRASDEACPWMVGWRETTFRAVDDAPRQDEEPAGEDRLGGWKAGVAARGETLRGNFKAQSAKRFFVGQGY